MPLFIECPSGHRLKVPSKLAGHSIVCPVCDEKISVPPLAAPPKPMLRPVSKKTQPVAAKPKSEPIPAPASELDSADQQDKVQQPNAEQLDRHSSPQEPSAAAPIASPEPAAPPEPAPPETSTSPLAESVGPKEEVGSPPFQLDLPTEGRQVTQRLDHEHSLRPPTSPSPIEDDYDRPYAPEFPMETPYEGVGLGDNTTPNERYEDDLENYQYSDVEQGEVQSEENDQVTWIHVDTEPAPKESKKSLRDNQYFGVLALGIAAIMVAVFCAIPSVIDQVLARRVGINAPDNWTYVVLLGSLVQVAVAIYAMRLPDWTTSWIASITATAFAAMYALGLALTMFASQEHQLVQELGLLDEAFHYRAQPWCFLVMCITLILAFCYGRFSLRWYHLERQLAHVG